MNASIRRLLCGAAVYLLAIGCAQVGDGNASAPTAAQLQGMYDLKTDAMTADQAGGDAFSMIDERLEIGAATLTFAPTFEGMGLFTLAGNTLTVTHGNGYADVIQASFDDTGNTLTLVDEIGQDLETFVFVRRSGTGTSDDVTKANLQETYDLDTTRSTVRNFPDLDSGELEVEGNIITTSLTFSQTRPYALVGNSTTLTERHGDTSVLQAAMSQDSHTLTLSLIESQATFVNSTNYEPVFRHVRNRLCKLYCNDQKLNHSSQFSS